MRLRIAISLCVLLGSLSQLHAQHHQVLPAPFPQPRANVSDKVASHNDLPQFTQMFQWNSSQQIWDSTYRRAYTYSPTGEISEILTDWYNGSAFVPNEKQINTVTGPTTNIVYQTWNGNAWQNANRSENTVDNFGNTTLHLNYAWSGLQWDTTDGDRTTYQYVLTDKIAQKTVEHRHLGSQFWNNLTMDQFTWHAATGWDTAIYASWNGNSWDLTKRYVGATWYDFARGLIASYVYQDYSNAQWNDYLRFAATFGPNDDEDAVIERWNGSTWDSLYKDFYVHDTQGHEISYQSNRWNGSWGQMLIENHLYTYDFQNHTTEVILQQGFWGPALNERREVYSNFFVTGLDPQWSIIEPRFYPNPCVDHLNFQLDLKKNGSVNIALYDLQGRLRMQMVTPAQAGKEITLPISEILENGTYIYRIQTKEGTATGKVAVHR